MEVENAEEKFARSGRYPKVQTAFVGLSSSFKRKRFWGSKGGCG